MITTCTLHNSGGSDESTTFTLATAFWVTSHEMGKALTPKQLGHESPSVPFFSNWEKRCERGVELPMPLEEMKWKEAVVLLRLDNFLQSS